ncbi:hypothetical protein NUM_06070 [Actinocatenispora comari]|uniref:Uncharacterized protein n=2 Tax=Actinocatenispora comari TaxID=2807577 RepID=A0A8J4AA38_9ACTN|nr:hypothetical protein NUM_06070 [Actinocatenispora comari]
MPGPGRCRRPPTDILLTGIAAASCLVVGTLHWSTWNIDQVRDATAPNAGVT